MKAAIAAAAAASTFLSLLSACSADALDADASLRREGDQINQLVDNVLFFEALVMPTADSQIKSANEVRS